MQRIVSDDQRRPAPQSARPSGVVAGSPLAPSRRLQGATSPCGAPFLSSGPPDAIRVGQIGREVL